MSGNHPHAFPDVTLNGFGIEIKFTEKDSWLSVENSVFEGMRTKGVESIHVIFGKAGGEPTVRWSRYEDCVTHVRVSHSPRFVIEMDGNRSSLFDHLGVEYDTFRELPDTEKIRHIRKYSRNRLKPGERLWWIEEGNPHTIPVEIRLYMRLPQSEQQMLRAEAAVLSPQIAPDPV